MKTYLYRSLGDAERRGSLTHVHFFDVPEQHDVTVNLREPINGLAQHSRELFLLQCKVRDLAPAGKDRRSKIAGLVVRERVERVLTARFDLAQPAQALIPRNGKRPGAELRFPAKKVQVAVDLQDRLLRGILGLGLIANDRKQEKVNGALAGANQLVKKLLFASQNAANTVRFGLRIGCVLHLAWSLGLAGGAAACVSERTIS